LDIITHQEGGLLAVNLNEFTTFLISQKGKLLKSQIKTLAAISFAVFLVDRIGVAELGRSMKSNTTPKHNIKRVDRFLGNLRVIIKDFSRMLIGLILSALNISRVLVAMDWTDMEDGVHQTLILGLVACGRTLPLYWRTVRKDELKNHQSQIEAQLLRDFREIIPADIDVVIVADRGFGYVELCEVCQELGFHFCFRVKRKADIVAQGFTGNLRNLDLKPGTMVDWGWILYTRSRYRVRFVTCFAFGQKDAWLLITDIEDPVGVVVACYAKRWEIEECIRDLKNERTGLSLRGVTLKTAERYDRLLLVVAVGYLFLVITGAWGEAHNEHRRIRANTVQRRTHALWKVGQYLIKRSSVKLPALKTLFSYLCKVVPGSLAPIVIAGVSG